MDTVNLVDRAVHLEWMEVVRRADAGTRAVLGALAENHVDALAAAFFDGMRQDPVAGQLLGVEAVDARLRVALKDWIQGLLTCVQPQQITEQVSLQRRIGAVHARVDVRIDQVLHGARLLKLAMAAAILQQADLPPATRLDAIVCSTNLVDLALEIMAAQYVNADEVSARTDEAFRTFVASANMALERERQRNALLDWENRVLHEVMHAAPETTLPRLGESAMGLWLSHKAPSIFRQGEELAALVALQERIDDTLLPLCQREMARPGSELQRLLRDVRNETGQVRHLIDLLFDHFVDLEAGRDALTQLLNRRFLPAVLRREVELCRRAGKTFALLLVDVDHFKHINDTHGHDAGDRVLQHLAQVLINSVRSGDSVFRYGGEEFLVVCVELTAAQATRVAEKIRVAVESEDFLLADGARLHATVSIGLAMYDRHPDYQHLIDLADQGLYKAKNAGRNRCVMVDGVVAA